MRQIKIAVTTDVFYDQRVKRIAQSLAEAGYDVELIGRKKRGVIYKDASLHFSVHLLSCIFHKGFLFYAEYNIRLLFYLLRKAVSNNCIVTACDLDTLLACTLYSRWKKCRLFFDAHEYFEEVPELSGRTLVKNIWQKIGMYCMPYTHTRYTVSQSLVDVFSKKYNLPFFLVRNIPSVLFKTPQTDRDKKCLYYQGAVNTGRGLEVLLDSLCKLPDYHLVIVGEGDILDALKVRAIQLQLSHRVKFTGRLEFEEMMTFASKAGIGFNLCAPESLSYYYSLSNKTFEYLHAGLPSVHMHFPEYDYLFKQYTPGCQIQNISIEEIIPCVRQLENPEFYSSCTNECQRAALILDWKHEEKQLLSLYQ